MTEATLYEIVLRGRASSRFLRPLVDDFSIDHSRDGVTVLIGEIRDPSHLHGVLVHLTSVNAEVISIALHQTASHQTASHQNKARP